MALKSTLSRTRGVGEDFGSFLQRKLSKTWVIQGQSCDLEDNWRRWVQRSRQSPRTYLRWYSSTECQIPEEKTLCFQLCRNGSQTEASKSEDRVSARSWNQGHKSKQDSIWMNECINEWMNEIWLWSMPWYVAFVLSPKDDDRGLSSLKVKLSLKWLSVAWKKGKGLDHYFKNCISQNACPRIWSLKK